MLTDIGVVLALTNPITMTGFIELHDRLRWGTTDAATIDTFRNAPRNALYISWHTHNKIISLFAKQI